MGIIDSLTISASQYSLLDSYAYSLKHSVFAVAAWGVAITHVHTEESPEGLPESRPESAHKGLDDVVALLVRLAVDKLD